MAVLSSAPKLYQFVLGIVTGLEVLTGKSLHHIGSKKRQFKPCAQTKTEISLLYLDVSNACIHSQQKEFVARENCLQVDVVTYISPSITGENKLFIAKPATAS